MLHAELRGKVEHIGDHRSMSDAAEGQRSNELPGCLGHHHINGYTLLGQLAGDIHSLIGSDAAGYTENYILTLSHTTSRCSTRESISDPPKSNQGPEHL